MDGDDKPVLDGTNSAAEQSQNGQPATTATTATIEDSDTHITQNTTKRQARASMLTVYIEEAHAVDEWAVPLPRRTGGHIKFARTIQDRIQAARDFVRDHSYPGDLVCDSMEGDMVRCFDAWPERLYIIEDGVVVYKGGIGPFLYEPKEVLQWLQRRFDEN
jgi:hypothetical protein